MQQLFKRLEIFTSMLNAIVNASDNQLVIQQRIADIGSYRSRGKGGKQANTCGHKHMANVRAARKSRNIAKRSKN